MHLLFDLLPDNKVRYTLYTVRPGEKNNSKAPINRPIRSHPFGSNLVVFNEGLWNEQLSFN